MPGVDPLSGARAYLGGQELVALVGHAGPTAMHSGRSSTAETADQLPRWVNAMHAVGSWRNAQSALGSVSHTRRSPDACASGAAWDSALSLSTVNHRFHMG